MRSRLLASKVADDVRLTIGLLRSAELPRADRLRLLVVKYAAIAANRRSVRYLGHRLHYDNRLTPALLPAYLEEIGRLDAVVDLASCRTVIDVGANVGQFGATLAWRHPHLTVWSFEPNPAAGEHLERNAAQSSGWTAVPWGIGAEDGTLELFYVPGKSAQGSSRAENARAGLLKTDVTRVAVPVRRLSHARLEELGIPAEVDVLKVDVEGAEAAVLEGLTDVRWRYLLIEASEGREGLGLEDVVSLVEARSGRRPIVAWAAPAGPATAARDAILRAT